MSNVCEKQRVTPYMHAMVYHLPGFMAKHGGVKKFTGQGQNFFAGLYPKAKPIRNFEVR